MHKPTINGIIKIRMTLLQPCLLQLMLKSSKPSHYMDLQQPDLLPNTKNEIIDEVVQGRINEML